MALPEHKQGTPAKGNTDQDAGNGFDRSASTKNGSKLPKTYQLSPQAAVGNGASYFRESKSELYSQFTNHLQSTLLGSALPKHAKLVSVSDTNGLENILERHYGNPIVLTHPITYEIAKQISKAAKAQPGKPLHIVLPDSDLKGEALDKQLGDILADLKSKVPSDMLFLSRTVMVEDQPPLALCKASIFCSEVNGRKSR